MEWQLQHAKNKLSELVDRAIEAGPQEISRHGKKTAVVLSLKDYNRLKAKKGNLLDFFRKSPLGDITLERSQDLSRRIEF